MTEDDGSRRLELVRTAQQQWIEALTDLGGRNTLLYYKDRRAGTLDLAQADPEALDRFTERGSMRLTRLFKDADLRADAIRRIQAIHRKARELFEERGIRAGYLATGLARWDELFLEPAAPVLLRGLTIAPTRARYDDFELILFRLGAKRLGEKTLENVLTDLSLKSATDETGRRFAGTEAGQIRAFLNISDDPLGFLLDFLQRYRDFEFVLATFNQSHEMGFLGSFRPTC